MIKNNNNLKKWLEEKLPHLGNLNKIEKKISMNYFLEKLMIKYKV